MPMYSILRPDENIERYSSDNRGTDNRVLLPRRQSQYRLSQSRSAPTSSQRRISRPKTGYGLFSSSPSYGLVLSPSRLLFFSIQACQQPHIFNMLVQPHTKCDSRYEDDWAGIIAPELQRCVIGPGGCEGVPLTDSLLSPI